jgi:hypothetical protein
VTKQIRMSKEELRAALPEVAAFVDVVRDVFGEGVRVTGIRTKEWTMGRPDVPPGIRLSDCVWDRPSEPEIDHHDERSARRRRRA